MDRGTAGLVVIIAGIVLIGSGGFMATGIRERITQRVEPSTIEDTSPTLSYADFLSPNNPSSVEAGEEFNLHFTFSADTAEDTKYEIWVTLNDGSKYFLATGSTSDHSDESWDTKYGNWTGDVDVVAPSETGDYVMKIKGIRDDGYIIGGDRYGDITVKTPTYNLSTTVSGSGSINLDPDKSGYSEGESVTLEAVGSSGYIFDSWSGDISGDTNPKTITMDSDKSITANFSEDIQYYTLSTSVESGAGSISLDPDQSEYEEGTVVNVTANPASGYVLDCWSGDASGDATTLSITMDSNKTVRAYFKEEPDPEYSLSTITDPTDGGTVTVNPDQDTYTEGTEVTLTASPSSGYNWSNWSGDASGDSKQITTTMTSDKSITANFSEEVQKEYYSLSTEVVSGQGSIEPFGGTYEAGSQVTLQAKPDEGWSFVSWGGDWSGSSNPTTITMDSDKHITASFNEIQPDYVELTIKSNPNEGGQTTITENYIPRGSVKAENPAAFLKGTVVELEAQPNSGYKFVHWSGDATGDNRNIAVEMDSDKEITAHYDKKFSFKLSTPILLVVFGLLMVPIGVFLRWR